VAQIAAMQPSISRSSEKRESVMMRAQVWMPGARTPTDHRIRNLSPSGACIGTPGWLKRGDPIRVTIGHVFDVDATVMWVAEGQAGIRFDRPIDMAAARRSRSAGVAAVGWMGGMNDAYRR
jgi:hypothetical protein